MRSTLEHLGTPCHVGFSMPLWHTFDSQFHQPPWSMLLHLLLHGYHQILSNATLLYKSLVTKTPRSPLELLRRFSGASFTLISQRGQPCLKNCLSNLDVMM